MPTPQKPSALIASLQIGEVLHSASFTTDDLARACGVAPDWVQARVEAEVLHIDRSSTSIDGSWRFDSFTLMRARRIAQLESTFDADPQLAALTADLIEEVMQLRRRLKAFGVANAHLP